MVGLPAVVSWKKKLPAPPVIDTEVMLPSKGPAALVSKNIEGESEERLAVPVNVVTWLSNTSRISKLTTADGTPDTTVWGAEVINTWVSGPGIMVWI